MCYIIVIPKSGIQIFPITLTTLKPRRLSPMNIDKSIDKVLLALFSFLFTCTNIAFGGDITVTAAAQDLVSYNHSYATGHQVPLVKFRIKSESPTTQQLTQIRVPLRYGGTSLKRLIAREGESESQTEIGQTTDFYWHVVPVNLTLNPNSSRTITIYGEFGSNPSLINQAVVQAITVGDEEMFFSELKGPKQYIYNNTPVANFELVGLPTISKVDHQDGTTTEMTATFSFDVFANGGDIKKPTADDFSIFAGRNIHDTNIKCQTVSVVAVPNQDILDGTVSRVTVTTSLVSSEVAESGMYGFKVKSISWSNVATDSYTDQYWGLEKFVTPTTLGFIKNGSTLIPPVVRVPTIHYNLYEYLSGLMNGGESTEPYQVKGEGGSIHFSNVGPHNRYQSGYVVIPESNLDLKGFVVKFDASADNVNLNPYLYVSSSSLLSYSSVTLQNVQTVSDDNGQTTETRFDFVANGVSCHGKLVRIGKFSCIGQIFWGANSTADGPGDAIDKANLSESSEIEGKNFKFPPRFEFKMLPPTLYIPSPGVELLVFEATCIPGSFKIQGTSNLKNWVDVSHGFNVGAPINEDGVAPIRIDIDKSILSMHSLDDKHCSFRLVSRE